jgi:hypothetical protein
MLMFVKWFCYLDYYTDICITIKQTNKIMAKPIKCKLRLHGQCSEFTTSEFESISKAKQWVAECWDKPYTILRLK